MGRKKTVKGTAKSNTHTFYAPPGKWELYQKIAESMKISARELLRRDMDATIKKYYEGELKEEFDLEAKKADRLKLKKAEDNYFKLLTNEVLPNRRTAYEVLCDFAGIDTALSRDVKQVLARLQLYECVGSESFTASTIETFIEYIEVVLERRRPVVIQRQRVLKGRASLPIIGYQRSNHK